MPWREKLKTEHARRVTDNLWRQRSVIESPQGREVVVAGRRYLNFCSNDYLGLASHPLLKDAAAKAIETRGMGTGASHLVCGHMDAHHLLELEVAEFVNAEQAIVFSTGYMANLAIPQTFLNRRDLIVEDRLNHASLIDAGRFCDADMKRYPHRDLTIARKLLTNLPANRKMLATDGVFSMDGDIAPLAELRDLCVDQGALLLVDDAHGFGVLGTGGIGALEDAGVPVGGGVLMLGTLGKSAGSFGAFVAGDAVYIESLVQFARPYIYTTALPPSVVAAGRTALQIMRSEPGRRTTLHQNVTLFRQLASDGPLPLTNSSTPIQPIILGNPTAALNAAAYLKQHGIWVTAIRPPTVPAGSSRLRLTFSADHTAEDIKQLVALLRSDEMHRIARAPQ